MTKRDLTRAEVIAKPDGRFAATEGRFLAMDEPFAIGQRNLRRAHEPERLLKLVPDPEEAKKPQHSHAAVLPILG